MELSLLSFSVVVMKYPDQKQRGGGRVCFALTFQRGTESMMVGEATVAGGMRLAWLPGSREITLHPHTGSGKRGTGRHRQRTGSGAGRYTLPAHPGDTFPLAKLCLLKVL